MSDIPHSDLRQVRYRYYLPNLFESLAAIMTLTADRVQLLPIEIPFRVTVNAIVIVWESPVVGNVRAGIYRDGSPALQPAGGSLIVQSGSVAKTGTWRKQEITIADTPLNPGLYWIAVLTDESTTDIWRVNADFTSDVGLISPYRYTLAYGPLTNPCPAVVVDAITPNYLLKVRSIP